MNDTDLGRDVYTVFYLLASHYPAVGLSGVTFKNGLYPCLLWCACFEVRTWFCVLSTVVPCFGQVFPGQMQVP